MALSRNEKLTLTAALIGSPLLSVVADLFRKVPIFSTIRYVALWLADLLVTLLTYEVQVWLVVLIVFMFIAGLTVYAVVDAKKKSNTFSYLTYTEDTIDGYRWTWEYTFDAAQNKHIIGNLRAFCPQCDSPIRHKSTFLDNYTACIRCDYKVTGNVYGDNNRIELLVIDNITKRLRADISQTAVAEEHGTSQN
jgi:hypothetical protein